MVGVDCQRAESGAEWRAWAAVAVLCLGLFVLGLDFTVLNVAVPSLRQELRPSMAQVQWIIDGYALVLGGCVLAAGAVSDAYGRRRCFVAGVGLCGVASLLGSLAAEPWQLIAARGGMGAGAALLMPATLALITQLFPEGPQRRKAVSLWALVAGIGALTGPVVGGWLVEHHTWRAAFWAPVPCIVVTLLLALLLLPESRGSGQRRRIDLRGAALSTVALLSLVWGIIEGPRRGWDDLAVVTAFGCAVLLLAVFVRYEGRAAAPMLPAGLLRSARLRAAALVLALLSFAVFGALFVLSLYLQGVLEMSPLVAGKHMLPLSAAMAAGVVVAFRMERCCGERCTVLTGALLVAGAFGVLAGAGPGSGYGRVLVFELAAGLGTGVAAPTATAAVMACLPPDRAGAGSALNDATRQVGSTLGVAVQGSVLSEVCADRVHTLLADLPRPVAEAAGGGLPGASAVPAGLPDEQRAEVLAASRDAFVSGMAAAAQVALAVALVAALAAWRLLGRRPSRGVPAATAMAPTVTGLLAAVPGPPVRHTAPPNEPKEHSCPRPRPSSPPTPAGPRPRSPGR